jgi:hypothetical protein
VYANTKSFKIFDGGASDFFDEIIRNLCYDGGAWYLKFWYPNLVKSLLIATLYSKQKYPIQNWTRVALGEILRS